MPMHDPKMTATFFPGKVAGPFVIVEMSVPHATTDIIHRDPAALRAFAAEIERAADELEAAQDRPSLPAPVAASEIPRAALCRCGLPTHGPNSALCSVHRDEMLDDLTKQVA